MGDNRSILVFKNVSYSVSDLLQIYSNCKNSVPDKNNLEELYDFFKVKPKRFRHFYRHEIIEEISRKQKLLLTYVSDLDLFGKAIKLARRKFIYWGNVDSCIYGIIDSIHKPVNSKSLSREDTDIPKEKDLLDGIITYACYYLIVNGTNVQSAIEDDKLCKYKRDYEFVKSLRYFASDYEVGEELDIDIDNIFIDIYRSVSIYEAESVYECFLQHLSKEYDVEERRIFINNEYNTEFSTLWHYVIKLLTEPYEGKNRAKIHEEDYQNIVKNLKYALVLLDSNKEIEISFILPNHSDEYLETLMKYSALYDLHQYDIEGILFLIKKIFESFSNDIYEYFNEPQDVVFQVICELLEKAQDNFMRGETFALEEEHLTAHQKMILERMTATNPLDLEYLNPLNWDKVNDDSEWIIKRGNKYYILVPILSGLGVYDRIGKALGWKDFGPQIETAVKDLFSSIDGVEVFSGNYILDKQTYESDAIVCGKEYALLIECKRKGISRKSRGGNNTSSLTDLAETYFESQKQALRTYRAIKNNNDRLELYPVELGINCKKAGKEKYEKEKSTLDFSYVKHIIRVSCTGGNFWISAEGAIIDNIERMLEEDKSLKIGHKYTEYIKEYFQEWKDVYNETKEIGVEILKTDKLFLSFDKLYSIVNINIKKGNIGDVLLKNLWTLARIQSIKGDTSNHFVYFTKLADCKK